LNHIFLTFPLTRKSFTFPFPFPGKCAFHFHSRGNTMGIPFQRGIPFLSSSPLATPLTRSHSLPPSIRTLFAASSTCRSASVIESSNSAITTLCLRRSVCSTCVLSLIAYATAGPSQWRGALIGCVDHLTMQRPNESKTSWRPSLQHFYITPVTL